MVLAESDPRVTPMLEGRRPERQAGFYLKSVGVQTFKLSSGCKQCRISRSRLNTGIVCRVDNDVKRSDLEELAVQWQFIYLNNRFCICLVLAVRLPTTIKLFMATWRNGSAFGFDRPTVPKGCRFESCGGHDIFKFVFLSFCHLVTGIPMQRQNYASKPFIS